MELYTKNKFFGFTLVELLVVTSIVGLLSSTVATSVQESRIQAAATQTVENMRQLRIALEAYHQDKGYYPRDQEFSDTVGFPEQAGEGKSGVLNGVTYDGGDLKHLVEEGYLPSVPKPPASFLPNHYFYMTAVREDQGWKCGGKNVGGIGNYVVYYYYIGYDDAHGELPDGIPTLTVGSTDYPHMPCFSNVL